MLSLLKGGSIKQFVVYRFGCKEKWEYGGQGLKEKGGLNKFHASKWKGY